MWSIAFTWGDSLTIAEYVGVGDKTTAKNRLNWYARRYPHTRFFLVRG